MAELEASLASNRLFAVDGRDEKIRAGMRVSAAVKTGDGRAIEYLLLPVVQAVKEAGRELVDLALAGLSDKAIASRLSVVMVSKAVA